ncbi:MAG: UvrD-helicase domain-containing protein, partial [Defluviitaleaceae bacterium]|nr:UvrD-helicase domain-containing protein [Defluviitaleaceae bacterium]
PAERRGFGGRAPISLDATPWAKVAREELVIGLEGALEGIRQAIEICHMPDAPYKYLDRLEEEKSLVLDLKAAINLPFENMYDAFQNITWGRLPSVTAKDMVDPLLKSRVQRIRDTVKKRVKALVSGIFFAPPGKMLDDLTALAPRVSALMALASRFSAAYAAEKRARNILDFTDLEHFAIKILYPNGPEDMTPDPAFRLYHEVLIDEYQDSNEIQDLILSAVAERRFMVGDVKQSIYRFRRANPGLFIKKYNSFKVINPEEKGESEGSVRIDLSHNFRSRPEILTAVNFFFSRLMCPELGEVEYDSAAALQPGRNDSDSSKTPRIKVELLDQTEDGDGQREENDADEPADNVIAETRVIAGCIHELLATQKVWSADTGELRPCRLGDIAILTRGLTGIAGTVLEELKNHGIDAVADMNAGFFEQQEVKTALSFLRVTDNPRQDIDLITVLSCPVYDFSPDELFEISRNIPRTEGAMDFYDCLVAASAEKENDQPSPLAAKAQSFLLDLENWRAASVYLPVSRLIGLIYDSTRYPAFVGSTTGGAIRQANLRLLLERAIEFEETGLKGLFHFIRYIERLGESGNVSSASEPHDKNTGDRVRLMTIHKSKGLEFPVVICGFLAKQFNLEDERRPVILHSEMGVGPYYVNSVLRTRSNTLARFSLARMTRRENLSEELRCLYVAMTRAKEILILTGRAKNLQASMEKWEDYANQCVLPLYYRLGVKSYLDWLMPCLIGEKNEALFRINIRRIEEIPTPTVLPKKPGEEPEAQESPRIPMLKPHIAAHALPSKLSISEIKRLYDITPDSTPFTERGDASHHSINTAGKSPAFEAPSFEPPAFIQAESGVTPMGMGSALHVITEAIDYHTHTTQDAIKELIADLTEKNLLDPEDAAAIDTAKILQLTNSPLADRLRRAEKIYRETPFVLAIPAEKLYPGIMQEQSQESILVHGIIDCHFEEDGQIVLLDFKSDNIPRGMTLSQWGENHRVQLEIYKQALAKATQTEVKEVLLYSFSRGEAVSLREPDISGALARKSP